MPHTNQTLFRKYAPASVQENQIQAFLLGSFALYQDDTLLNLPTLIKARHLLAYLLLNPSRAHNRLYLAGLFWPDKSESQARRALSHALWQARQSCPNLITSRQHKIQIAADCGVWIDMVMFKTYLNAADSDARRRLSEKTALLWEAVQYYQGDLLEGVYEDWVVTERSYLQQMYSHTLEKLIGLEKQQQNYKKGLEAALKLVQINSLHESVHREIIRFYMILNQPKAAQRQFETCCEILRAELGLEPEPETVALWEQIVQPNMPLRLNDEADILPTSRLHGVYLPQAKVKQPTFDQAALPLIGRQQELMYLFSYASGLLTPQQTTQGGVVLIEGEAGVGKSHLLQAFTEDVTWHDIQVLWGYCQQMSTTRPYGLLIDALAKGLTLDWVEQLGEEIPDIWLKILSQILPELIPITLLADKSLELGDYQDQKYLVEAFYQLLYHWTKIKPLVLILEDLHWADEDTLALLATLSERLSKTRLLIVATYRGNEVKLNDTIASFLQTLVKNSLASPLILFSLDKIATANLIRQVLGISTTAPDFENRVYQETGGNPLFILETLRALYAEGILYQDEDGTWHTPCDETTTDYRELPLTGQVERTIERRLQWLKPELRQILETTAILGDKADLTLLSNITKLETERLYELMLDLSQQKFLKETGPYHQFSHDKVQEVVYETIPPQDRKKLHQQTVYVLEQIHFQQLETLNYHAIQGELWDKAVLYMLEAAKMAQAVYFYQRAIAYYTQVLDLVETYTPFESLYNAKLCFEALLARYQLYQLRGETASQLADIEGLQKLAHQLQRPKYQIQTLNQQAQYLYKVATDYAQARVMAQNALDLIRKYGQADDDLLSEEAMALQIIGVSYIYDAVDYQKAATYLRKSLNQWPKIPGSLPKLVGVYRDLLNAYDYLGQKENSQQTINTLLELGEGSDNPLVLMQVYDALTMQGFMNNDAIACLHYAKANVHLVETHNLIHYQPRLMSNLGVFYTLAQQFGEAITTLNKALALDYCEANYWIKMNTISTLGELYRRIGCYPKSITFLTQGLQGSHSLPDSLAKYVDIWGSFCRVHLQQDQLDALVPYVNQLQQIVAELKTAYLLCEANLSLGLVYQARGQVKEAISYFEQAQSGAIKAVNRLDRVALCASYIAVCYLALNDLKRAITLSNQAVAHIKNISIGNQFQRIYYHHWQIMHRAKEPDLARLALEKAYAILQKQKATLANYPDLQRGFIDNVPLNREIVRLYEVCQTDEETNQITITLPKISAPRRGRLNVADMKTIIWTIETPADKKITTKKAQRHQKLLRLLAEAEKQGAIATVNHLAEVLAVSEKTIRLDLNVLRRANHPVKTRGRR